MAYDPKDPVTARALLEDALALTTRPTLTLAQVNRAFTLASSLDANGVVVYLPADLNRSAAWGWGVKQGITSDQYDLGGGERKLTRDQWFRHCGEMADAYRSGTRSVTGTNTRRSSIGSVGTVTSTAVAGGELL